MSKIWVFFVGYRKRHHGWRSFLRLLMRRPSLAYAFFCAWATSKLSRSDLIHVAISDTKVVLDPGIFGNVYWEAALFSLKYPRLVWCVEIRGLRDPCLARFEEPLRRTKVCLPTFLRWLTGFRCGARDCVTVVVSALRHAGESVPERVITPQDLFDYLKLRGHTRIDMT